MSKLHTLKRFSQYYDGEEYDLVDKGLSYTFKINASRVNPVPVGCWTFINDCLDTDFNPTKIQVLHVSMGVLKTKFAEDQDLE